MNCEICRWWTVVVHGGLRSVFHFTDRPSWSYLSLSRNRNLGCMHGDLRPWFTGRKSLYGPSTRSYLTIHGWQNAYGSLRQAVYGPYCTLRSVFGGLRPLGSFSANFQFFTFSTFILLIPIHLRTLPMKHYTLEFLALITSSSYCVPREIFRGVTFYPP